MKLSTAVESLLPGELADRVTVSRTAYGSCVELVLFGRRLIVDVVKAAPSVAPRVL